MICTCSLYHLDSSPAQGQLWYMYIVPIVWALPQHKASHGLVLVLLGQSNNCYAMTHTVPPCPLTGVVLLHRAVSSIPPQTSSCTSGPTASSSHRHVHMYVCMYVCVCACVRAYVRVCVYMYTCNIISYWTLTYIYILQVSSNGIHCTEAKELSFTL